MVKTIGVSPKVKVPSLALGIVGVLMVLASALVDGLEDLREPGITLVIASPIGAALGWQAPVGQVEFVDSEEPVEETVAQPGE